MLCPHCKAEVENAVEKSAMEATIQERLKVKSEEIKALKEGLTASQRTAAEATTATAERDRLAGELAAIKSGAEQSAAFAAAGIPADEKVRAGFLAMHASESAGVEKPPTLGEWLAAEDGAKAHPLLAPHFAQPAAAAPAGTVAAAAAARAAPANPDSGARPAGGPVKRTPQMYSDALDALRAKGLPPGDLAKAIRTLRAEFQS